MRLIEIAGLIESKSFLVRKNKIEKIAKSKLLEKPNYDFSKFTKHLFPDTSRLSFFTLKVMLIFIKLR